MSALQALEIVGQLHGGAQQCFAGLFRLRADAAIGDGCREMLHFLGDHRRRVQLQHAQRAFHLSQLGSHAMHQARVVGLFGERTDIRLHLFQRGVELRLDPAQRRVLDRFAERAHAGSPNGRRNVLT